METEQTEKSVQGARRDQASQGGYAHGSALFSLAIVWGVVAPLLFIMLYAVIETQAAARSAIGENTKLAPYTISRIAKDLREIEPQLAPKRDARRRAEEEWQRSQNEVTNYQGSEVAGLQALAIRIGVDSRNCYDLGDCLDALIARAANLSPADLPPVQEQVSVLQGKKARFLDLNAIDKAKYEIWSSANRDYVELERKWNGQGTAEDWPGEASLSMNAKEQPLQQSSPATPIENAHAVAMSYNLQRAFNPLFELFFFMPSGVLVAFFTSLMGAIGGAMSSLMRDLNETPEAALQNRPAKSLWQAYGATPLLGALAGFTVFFVISAGTTFLVQPGSLQGVDAVNQLSPPALAALGAFAGLGAQRAVQWLLERSEGFFKTQADEEREVAERLKASAEKTKPASDTTGGQEGQGGPAQTGPATAPA